MRERRPFLPVTSGFVIPSWLIYAMLAVSAACVLGGMVLLGSALLVERTPNERWGLLGGAFGCIVGGLGSFLGCYNTYQMQQGAVHVFYRLQRTGVDVGMAVYGLTGAAFLAWGLVQLAAGAARADWYGPLLLASIVLLQVIGYGVFRWVILRNARALFSLYLDGALTPEETAAIDEARRAHSAFDAMIREFDTVNRAVREWTHGGLDL